MKVTDFYTADLFAKIANPHARMSRPTYTTGQISPLSLNTSGGLRTDGSGVTQPISFKFYSLDDLGLLKAEAGIELVSSGIRYL